MDEARKIDSETLQGILADLRTALARLDEAHAPSDIGAHLSLVIDRLESFIERLPE